MAHYTAAVISKELNDVDKLLYQHGRYNIEREIVYSRGDLIKRGRIELEEFNKHVYSKYLIDKAEFTEKNKYYPDFINFVENVFPEEYRCSDEVLYSNIIRSIRSANVGSEGEVHMDYDLDRKYARYSSGEDNRSVHAFKNIDGSIRMDYRGKVKELIRNRRPSKQERKAFEEYWNHITKCKAEYSSSIPLDDETRKAEESYNKQRDNERRYLLDTYGDFENFLKYMTAVHTFAIVTPDGVWHENAIRNCLGEVTYRIHDNKEWIENYYDRFLKMYEEYYITFITFAEY